MRVNSAASRFLRILNSAFALLLEASKSLPHAGAAKYFAVEEDGQALPVIRAP
jgi:hypothetical protein